MKKQLAMRTVINSFFAQFNLLKGTPTFSSKNGKTIVQVPYFGVQLTNEKTNALGVALSKCRCPLIPKLSGEGRFVLNSEDMVRTRGSVEVRLVRLRYPYLDRNILAQYLAINANKYNFLRMKKRIFTARTHSSRGVKMELAGRLTTQRSIPRKTVLNAHKGSLRGLRNLNLEGRFANKSGLVPPLRGGSSGDFLFGLHPNKNATDFSQYASKNKMGAYTMKV